MRTNPLQLQNKSSRLPSAERSLDGYSTWNLFWTLQHKTHRGLSVNKTYKRYVLIIGLLVLIAVPLVLMLHLIPVNGLWFYVIIIIIILTLIAAFHDLKKIFRRK